MGFSALIPSLLALIQGSGRSICVVVNDTSSSLNSSETYNQKVVDPHFGVTLFFLFIFIWMLICTIAFALLNVRSIVDGQLNEQSRESSQEKQVIQDEENSIVSQQDDPAYKTESISERESIRPHGNSEDNSKNGKNGISNQFWVLMLVTFWCCALMNGILPSVQSYSALPYGSTVYYLSSVLSNISNPIGCFALFFFTIKRVNVVAAITIIITILSIYLLILASKSPHPVTSWVTCMALLAYLRAVCGSLLRESGSEKSLWWCGVFTQAGSFIGSLIMRTMKQLKNLATKLGFLVELENGFLTWGPIGIKLRMNLVDS
uniref:Riboflavin transporter n=1 Tax=Romanomermis culicivorax TaxID=13658 RepID=A0A915I7X8_ROMCU